MSQRPLPSGLPSKRFSLKNLRFHPALLPILSAAFAAFLLPREAGFDFKFEKNEAWQHADLVAQADFEVLRPAAEVAEKIQTIEVEHGRYFQLDPDVARYQKKRYSNLVERQVEVSRHDEQFADLVANQSAYQVFGQNLLENIYQRGIADLPRGAADPDAFAYVVFANAEKKLRAGELLTLRTAEEMLTDSLPFAPLRMPELILPLLEKCLVTNLQFSDSLTHASKIRKIAAARSAGFSVKKGEKIIEKGQNVDEEAWLKLNTLAEQQPASNYFQVFLGNFLATALAFFALFFALKKWAAAGFESSQAGNSQQVLADGQAPRPNFKIEILGKENWRLFAEILVVLASVKLLSIFGEAVPLLLPLFRLPHFWSSRWGGNLGLLAWSVVSVLVGFSLSWGGSWVLMQAAGVAAVQFIFSKNYTLEGRSLAAIFTGGAMCLAWGAAFLAGKLSAAVASSEVPVFLLVSAFIAWVFLPAAFSFLKIRREMAQTDLPTKI